MREKIGRCFPSQKNLPIRLWSVSGVSHEARLGAPEGAKVGPEKIVLRGVDAKLTAQAAEALNEALDTDLFEGGLLIGEATVIAQIGGDDDNGENENDD